MHTATKRWVTVVTPTLTGNAVFRTHTVVRLLSERFHIQLIAFEASSQMYGPLADADGLAADVKYHATNMPSWWWRTRRIANAVRGDVLVAVKPMLGSFGAALVLGHRLGRPVIVDIDDWEPGFLSSAPYWEARTWGWKWFAATESPLYTRILNGFVYRAAAVTVSNSFLQAIYGGHWIPHARDANAFQPATRLPSSGPKVVLFGGSPRGHKGLPALLRIWKGLRRSDAVLRLAVPEPDDSFLAALRPLDVPNVTVTGPHAFGEMPQILADASVVVVPQDNARGAVGQLPMKLIDAMAAAKPIVATDVCDTSRWLANGAGVVVTPGSDRALADALDYVLDHPENWSEMGANARTRLLSFASESLLAQRLCDVVSGVLAGRPPDAIPAFETAPSST